MTAIRVLLVDDHALVRAGIRALLDRMTDVEVVGETGDGHEAIRMSRALDPAVILIDGLLREPTALDVARRITSENQHARIVILAQQARLDHVVDALAAGAAGYVPKDCDVAELEFAIKTVVSRGSYIASAVARRVLESFLQHHQALMPKEELTELSLRQRQVLEMIAQGDTTKRIAAKLGISVKTVEMHRARLMSALDIHDVAGLVRFAIRAGLVDIEAERRA